jgi:UDP-N-acetylmuramoylalanine--D-glutamate ligase
VEALAQRGLAAPHIVANILAAAALARAAGIPLEAVRDTLLSFGLDAHRIQLVARSLEVDWVDDSKATNPHAADASLAAYRSVVWIVGGLLKGVSIDRLVERHADHLRAAVVIGADRSEVLDAFARHAPTLTVIEVDEAETESVMPEAVRRAAEVAQAGDTVLLAPAAASMDQFSDYGHRGRLFQAAVEAELGGEADDRSASR